MNDTLAKSILRRANAAERLIQALKDRDADLSKQIEAEIVGLNLIIKTLSREARAAAICSAASALGKATGKAISVAKPVVDADTRKIALLKAQKALDEARSLGGSALDAFLKGINPEKKS